MRSEKQVRRLLRVTIRTAGTIAEATGRDVEDLVTNPGEDSLEASCVVQCTAMASVCAWMLLIDGDIAGPISELMAEAMKGDAVLTHKEIQKLDRLVELKISQINTEGEEE